MTSQSLTNDAWPATVERLGGRECLEKEARETGAFRRAREIDCAVDCLRLVLGYCLGAVGLRLTAARAEALGIASISNVALLKRVRKAEPWLERLVARQLALSSPRKRSIAAAHGRLVRLVDGNGTTVAKKGLKDREEGGAWRVQSIFDLPTERFSAFELSDETVGEQFDFAAVVPGEIRIGDRTYLQPERVAKVLAAHGDIIIRARWNAVRWLDAKGEKADLIALLKAKRRAPRASPRRRGIIDQPIWIACAKAAPLVLRLVAIRRPKEARDQAIEKARKKALKNGSVIMPETLIAAEWMILVTSLPKETFSLQDISELYRLRWRIEIAFKHLKSGTGLTRPPAETAAMAKAYVLSHLLLILLTEPLIADHLGDSPRRAAA